MCWMPAIGTRSKFFVSKCPLHARAGGASGRGLLPAVYAHARWTLLPELTSVTVLVPTGRRASLATRYVRKFVHVASALPHTLRMHLVDTDVELRSTLTTGAQKKKESTELAKRVTRLSLGYRPKPDVPQARVEEHI